MPRRGGAGGRSAPSRPSAAPSRPTSAPPGAQQQRPHSTAAQPHQQQQKVPPAQGSQGSGLFGQMASTAAGVAVGSSIGHAIGGFFGGGSSAPAEQQQGQPQQYDTFQQAGQDSYQTQYNNDGVNCEESAQQLKNCLIKNGGDMDICGYYMDMLKQCKASGTQW